MRADTRINYFVMGILFILAAGWTYSWDVTTPAGTDSPSVIDNRIREVKQVVQEMLNVDHYFPLTGTQVSDVDAGKHRQVNFQANITTPAHATGETHLYQKGGELYWQDATNTEVALTSAGALLLSANSVGASQIATGAVTTAEILDGTITTADINDGTILVADLSGGVITGAWITQIFGAWQTKAIGAVYEATTDGIVSAWARGAAGNHDASIEGYTDSANPPTTMRTASIARDTQMEYGLTMPVKKGNYWKVVVDVGDGSVAASGVFWMPLGN